MTTQVPVTVTDGQVTGGLVVMVMMPLFVPGEVQVIRTVTSLLPPAGTTTGCGVITVNAAMLLELNPVMVNGQTATGEQGLVVDTVKVRSLLVPTQTLPKSKGFGDTPHAELWAAPPELAPQGRKAKVAKMMPMTCCRGNLITLSFNAELKTCSLVLPKVGPIGSMPCGPSEAEEPSVGSPRECVAPAARCPQTCISTTRASINHLRKFPRATL